MNDRRSTSLFCCYLLFALSGIGACSEPQTRLESDRPKQTNGLQLQTDEPATQSPGLKTITETGAYTVTLKPLNPPVRIAEPQSWIARITDARGIDFAPSALYFDGRMPGHGHGLPNAPEFTRHLGGSDYLLEGLSLNMPGDWRFVVTVDGPAGVDSAEFAYNLQPGELPTDLPDNTTGDWTDNQLALINSLRLSQLAEPTDLSNRLLENADAIALGKDLFNETGLSATGQVSCATCHKDALGFADGKQLGFGSAATKRHTPTLTGVAHASWFYWDGRRDSLWAQALTPIETPGEMDNNRTDAVRFVANSPAYRTRFAQLLGQRIDVSDTARFPPGASPFGAGKLAWHRMAEQDKVLLNTAFSIIGKAIAAYETTLQHQPSRFDNWANDLLSAPGVSNNTASTAASLNAPLNQEEQTGLRLFLDLPRTQCLRCHNGPLFSNLGFHNVATAEPAQGAAGTHDFGRMLGLQSVLVDPFNCSGSYSDASATDCDHLRFARRQNLGETIDGAFKVPSLRNLAASAPYFHDGRFPTLPRVIDHYRNQLENDRLGVSEVPDIALTDTERDQLVAFLLTL